MSHPRLVPVGDVELCVEGFGDAGDPPLLLLSGAAASMDWWPVELCELLAAGSRHVLRYDHRDTGRSTTWPVGDPGYDGGALHRDVVGLLEQLGLGPVHLVGVSMGGGIAQTVALLRPDLVGSVTLVATSPVGGVDPGLLPGPEPVVAALFSAPPPDPDWTDRSAVVDWFLAGEQAFSGPLGVDDRQVRASAGAMFDRSHDLAAAGNHWRVVGGEDDLRDPDVHDLSVPALVVHGSHDPFFPVAHGRLLADAIPGARLLVVQGMGHQVPPRPTWQEIVPKVLAHTSG